MWRSTAVLMALAGALVVAVAVGAGALDRPFGWFSREPSEVLGAPWHIGLLVHAGLLVWFTSAAVCLFAGALLARLRGLEAALPLLAGGAVCLFFSVDDGFRIHEDVVPGFLGVPKTLAYGLHALAFGAWLLAFREFVRRTDWPILALAVVLLAVSVGSDRVFESNQQHLLEDGVKFLGIVAWTAYFTRTAYASVLDALPQRAERPATPTLDEITGPARPASPHPLDVASAEWSSASASSRSARETSPARAPSTKRSAGTRTPDPTTTSPSSRPEE